MTSIPPEDEILYPASDGEPMAESQLHMQEIVYVFEALEERFAKEPDVFVAEEKTLRLRALEQGLARLRGW
jgi:hypothetical protein